MLRILSVFAHHRRMTCLGKSVLAYLLCATSVFGQDWRKAREQMVVTEIAGAGVKNERVLDAIRKTPRHEFVLKGWMSQAYFDTALPIGEAQTISPPYVVAYMTEQLDPQPSDRVLEIGTGSGYQAAVLSPLVDEVYTIEIEERLAKKADQTLRRLGYKNIHVRAGDGYKGWPEAAPFDKIIVTCSPESIPEPLIEQLAEGGQMIIPIGERYRQNIVRVTKRDGELIKEPLQATLFVPMTGAAEDHRRVLPDPSQPQVANGDFEAVFGKKDLPMGWHYLRQATTVIEGGNRYLSFANQEIGRPSQALQGLAIDGREVMEIEFSARVRGEKLSLGPTEDQLPAILITFYDQRRAVIANKYLGKWQGTFDWRAERKNLRVPPLAREAIIRLTLGGGTGRLDVDEVGLRASATANGAVSLESH
jgi:protein-L-isoaspartate(D-aspartate) O-methyltransferase